MAKRIRVFLISSSSSYGVTDRKKKGNIGVKRENIEEKRDQKEMTMNNEVMKENIEGMMENTAITMN